MPYQCKRCGSLELYHSCATRLMQCVVRTHPIVQPAALQVCCESLPSTTHTTVSNVNVNHINHNGGAKQEVPHTIASSPPHVDTTPLVTHATHFVARPCKRCKKGGAEAVKGWKWCYAKDCRIRVHGERLCTECRREICDELIDYIPRPPSQPGCYLITRTHKMARVSRKDGVTLLWLSGRYTEACELSRKTVKTIQRQGV